MARKPIIIHSSSADDEGPAFSARWLEQPIWTTQEVAALYRVPLAVVLALIRSRRLPALEIEGELRVLKADVLSLLKSLRANGIEPDPGPKYRPLPRPKTAPSRKGSQPSR